MGRDDKKTWGRGDPERRTVPRGSGARKQSGQPGRPSANDGRSGYGSESVRPHLRAQLRLKELLGSAVQPMIDPWGASARMRPRRVAVRRDNER